MRRVYPYRHSELPPFTPLRSIVYTVLEDMFDMIWSMIARSIAPFVQQTIDAGGQCNLGDTVSTLGSAMIIRPYTVQPRPGLRRSLRSRPPNDMSFRNHWQVNAPQNYVPSEGMTQTIAPVGCRFLSCGIKMVPNRSLNETLQVVSYDMQCRSTTNQSRNIAPKRQPQVSRFPKIAHTNENRKLVIRGNMNRWTPVLPPIKYK